MYRAPTGTPNEVSNFLVHSFQCGSDAEELCTSFDELPIISFNTFRANGKFNFKNFI